MAIRRHHDVEDVFESPQNPPHPNSTQSGSTPMSKRRPAFTYSRSLRSAYKSRRAQFTELVEEMAKRTKKKSGKKKFARFFLIIFFSLVFLGAAGGVGLFAYFAKDLPSPDRIADRSVAQTTKIFDRDGTTLYEIHGEEKRTIIPVDQIPEIMKKTTLAAEDADFYKHKGFDVRGIVRAVFANIRGEAIQGGSTITQQLVKNSILSAEQTYVRKIKELILAVELERKFSKDEILGMYLNQIPYGSNAYGVEAASQTFFGKPARELTLAESAYLSALPQAPTYYSPYGAHTDDLQGRQQWILDRMKQLGWASEEEMVAAKAQVITLRQNQETITAPHFVLYVKEKLVEEYGQRVVEQGGLQVRTTLSLKNQQAAEAAIAANVARIQSYGGSNAALTAINPKTGEILAMVGSVDYFDTAHDGNVNVAVAYRQPGSSYKPYVYATAWDRGYPNTGILFDVNTDFGGGYQPRNFDRGERGPVTMEAALDMSLNIPAIKAGYLAGINNVVENTKRWGLNYLNQETSSFGLSTAIGAQEIRLLDHVSAMGIFANQGKKAPYKSILEITDAKGAKIFEARLDESEQVLNANTANMVANVMSNDALRAPVFGARGLLTLPGRPVGAKTGTTEDFKDAWTVGYTPSLVTGVWVGNNDGRVMRRADGSLVAAPIWNAFMRAALEGTPVEQFAGFTPTKSEKPMLSGKFAKEEKLKIDKTTGKRATDLCPAEFVEEKEFKEVHDILHYVNKDNPLGPIPEKPQQDPMYTRWETPVLEWAKKKGFDQVAPTEEGCEKWKPENKPTITITSPAANSTITTLPLAITTTVVAPNTVKDVTFYIDDATVPFATVTASPYSTSIASLSNGEHTIKAIVSDPYTNTTETTVKVTVSIVVDVPLTVTLSKPVPGGVSKGASLALEATVTDDQTITSVEFIAKIAGGPEQVIGTGIASGSTYTASWTVPNEPIATIITIWARAKNNKSPAETKDSAAVSVFIKP